MGRTQYNFSPMIDEWCKEAPKELDFNHESENTRTVSKNHGCTNKYDSNKLINEVDVLIPEVIQSTEKVLILEYMDGIRLNDFESLEACGANKQKIVEEFTRAFAHQIYVDGFFNGDPHPGNFLVSKEPPHRPILLDFGLTKRISSSMKQSLAKMFLATTEGDHVALLSSFSEMELKLRLDFLEQAMDFISVFFRTSASASEAAIDAFPGDMVIFSRVIGLLRGPLSTTLDARIVYHDIMRLFAESVLQEKIAKGPSKNAQWINDTPVHSDVEAKLRQILVELGNNDKILGIQFGDLLDACKVFDEISHPCIVEYNAMLDAYVKNGDVGSACFLLKSMPKRDVVRLLLMNYTGHIPHYARDRWKL
ncbi:hypothetical protein SADUNF_Sadunf18G0002100 [Salix dunnii]|uniref:ABC1 atypical kinase-like domain-containing protein n=1 Tax=Salix dunnii TaxID=1413687 RepID=A0A835J2H8_9ROSI|nr:hypothetical protein SADUNF_Sadunf18G0002100 [Salix dunnii]